MKTLWDWWTGEITIRYGEGRGRGLSSDTYSRVVTCDEHPEEFKSTVMTHIAVGFLAIVFALLLHNIPAN